LRADGFDYHGLVRDLRLRVGQLCIERQNNMRNTLKWLPSILLAVVFTVGWQLWSAGQQPGVEKAGADKAIAEKAGAVKIQNSAVPKTQNPTATNRIEFEVVQSFDGKYLGDTPGHMGRTGGLTGPRPRIALGDRVYRGEELVGVVTSLELNRGNNSLDIEFNPVDRARVCVGDTVWLVFDSSAPRKTSEPQPVISASPQPDK
jgi:hypothetical protein